MSPVTHYLLGWLVANGNGFSRRERAAITLAGAAPDLDSLGIVPEIFTRNSAQPLHWYSDYHHFLGHNLAFSVVVAGASLLVAHRKLRTALFVLIAFHLHLLGDLVGARGPDGYQWPIAYWAPFTEAWQWSWNGQWELNAWPNFVITVLALTATFYLAWKRGYSPLEMFSKKADAEFVKTLRRRFSGDKAVGAGA